MLDASKGRDLALQTLLEELLLLPLFSCHPERKRRISFSRRFFGCGLRMTGGLGST